MIKKTLSSFLSLSLLFSHIPLASAQANSLPNNKSTSQKIKSIVSSPKFIIPTAISTVIVGGLTVASIYNIHFSKPRNPIENNIKGETDEKIKSYVTSDYSDIDRELRKVYYEEYCGSTCKEKLKLKISEILQEMDRKGCKTDYEKALFLHDYIYKHCKYDFAAVIDIITHNKTHFHSERVHYPPACLLDGNAVCSGMAMAYSLLLNTAGVECKYVFGLAKGFGHAWNIVKINGQWYHVDVTWDLFFKAMHGKYKWFMLTEEEISKDHEV